MAEDDSYSNLSLIASLSGVMDRIAQFTGVMQSNIANMMNAVNAVSYGSRSGGSNGGYTTSTPFPDSGSGSFGLGDGGGRDYASVLNSEGTRDYFGNYVDPAKDSSKKFLPGTGAAVLGELGGMALGLQQVLGMVMPSPQKGMYTEMLGERMRFYNRNISLEQAYNMQTAAGQLGMATSDMDPMYASNVAASRGLLPGLSNFGPTPNFGGVMGGAALFSNLSPGVGLQGGMGAVTALNQARNVNMLRMIGINVRNDQGTGMRDIPAIIDQLYDILSSAAGGDVTEQAIAVSAMSGNALDSLLNQYFGNDEVLRQSVLAALVQKARKGGGAMSAIGSKESLAGTGGLTQTVISTANRNVLGTRLAQQYATPVNTGTIQANNVISGITNMLNGLSSDRMIKGVTALQSFLEVLGGAGGGAGAGLIGLLTSGAGNIADIFSYNKGKAGPSVFSDYMLGLVGAASLAGSAAIGPYIPNPVSTATTGFGNSSPYQVNINVKWDWLQKATAKK